MPDQPNTIIESLGVYLPPQSFSTSEILEGCKNQIRFPLEKISGIKTRRMAGREEFSIDLAKKAITDCLEKSKYNPEDIDLLICCNISRYDAPDSVSFEPSTSVKLRKHFGFTNAIVFDITNACAGMFTGIYIVDALLKTGAIRRGMVVSGEYITHLTDTAQKEIENFMDMRLACLTLGDAGAAIILESTSNKQIGFQKIDLQTFGRYSPYCIAKVSEHGGWIMHTDSVNMTDVAIKSGAEHALDILKEAGWEPDEFQQLIMHQTSRMTLNSARREINNMLNEKVFDDSNTVNNLEERGNTASTSHFIAIADQIRNKKIQSGDKVVLSITASGLIVGTALYVFDGLPNRLETPDSTSTFEAETTTDKELSSNANLNLPGIRIESIGTIPDGTFESRDSMELLHHAATNCLEKSSYVQNDIGLLIHSGVYRDEHLLEPAYAALLAGKLNMNATISDPKNNKTLAFDIFNGAIGFLNACYVAQQMIAADNCTAAMVTASESENNRELFPDELMGVRETASAIILDAHPIEEKGFSSFFFNYNLESLEAYTSYCSTANIDSRLHIKKAPDLEEKYLAAIGPVVQELLQKERIDLTHIDMIFPPQISTNFILELGKQLGLPQDKFIDVAGEKPDLFSSSIPYGIQQAYDEGKIKSGDTGLIIAVGSGIQVGCAIYRF